MVIRCAHGDTILYPLAEVLLEVYGSSTMVEDAVSETPYQWQYYWEWSG